MNQLVRISKILNVEPFKITALWNNGEIRINDFTKFFENWKESEDIHLLGLTAWEVFKGVTVSNEPPRTLEWTNYPITFTFKGKTQTAPTDLDPDVLFQESTVVRMIESIPVGVMLKKAREKAGLTQTEVAINAGTTRNYISRIENGKSDIQVETLHKIVELGLGKELRLSINDFDKVEKSKPRLKFPRGNRNTKETDYSIEVPVKTTIDNLKDSKEEVLRMEEMREELKSFDSPLNKKSYAMGA